MGTRPKWPEDRLDAIFEKRRGKCSCCHLPICREDYGVAGAPGGWHVDHSRAIARGGHLTHMNNLEPVHIDCNLRKGTRRAGAVRAENGVKGPPLAPNQAARVRGGRAGVAGGVALLGMLALGATGPGALLVAATAALVGYTTDPDGS
jgi:5-methylcytosine-specific restriction endonuclease McrA